MSNSRLGKGLEALIRPKEDKMELKPGVTAIPIKFIIPNPNQPRQHFDKTTLNELAASISEKGVLTPVTVYQKGERFILIAGERRWRATKLAGLKNLPAYVVSVTGEEDVMEMALVENIQRENLNAIEEAEAYAYLNSKFDLSHTAIAKSVGKKRTTVSNSLRLLGLPSDIKDSLRDGKISAGHGRQILAMKTPIAMTKMWKKILDENLSVRGVEAIVKEISDKKQSQKVQPSKRHAARRVSPQIKQIEDELVSILGTKVHIHAKKDNGKIEVSYFSVDDLERILELLRKIN